MARPLSEEKRSAILGAATAVVAALGVSAPTVKIAKDAGVAEGTLFTYFPTKDELLNRLYLELKMDLRDAILMHSGRQLPGVFFRLVNEQVLAHQSESTPGESACATNC